MNYKIFTLSLLSLSSSPLALYAQNATVQLDTVTLSSGAASQVKGTGAATYLNADQIARTQASSLQDVLRDMPAVDTSRRGNLLGNGVTIRGFGGDHHYPGDPATKIVVDGVADNPGRHYQNTAGAISDPALLRSVNVTTGPLASLEYGAGITGGAVVADTINGADLTEGVQGWRLRQLLGASDNGHGSVSSTTAAWQVNDSFDMLLNFTRRQQDKQEDGSGRPLVTEGFNVPSVLFKARLRLDDANTLTFSHNRSEAAERNVPYSSTIGIMNNVDRDRKGNTTTLSWQHNPSGNDLVDLELKYSHSDQDHDIRPIAMRPPLSSWAGKFNIETDRLSLTNTARFATGSIQHNLRAGLAWSEEIRTRKQTLPATGTDRRLALFAINQMDFGNAFSASLGLRLEDQKISGGAPAKGPHNNLSRTLGLGLEKGVGYGFAVYGSATYTEALPSYDRMVEGDGEKLQKSRNYEIGVKYEGHDVFGAGDSLTASASYYQNYIWNATYQFNRDMDFRGVELAADYQMGQGSYLRGSAKLTDHQQEKAIGGWEAYTYNPSDTLGLTIGHKFENGLDLSWHTAAQAGIQLGQKRHKGFGVHDLKVSYAATDGVLKGTTFDFGIENIFDRTYSHSVTPTDSANKPYVFEPGRTLRLTASKTF